MGNRLSFHFFRRINRNKLLILYYHRIVEKKEAKKVKEINMCTDIDSFDAQMELLSKYYNPINEETIISGKIPDYSVWVTFDDGYKDNYINAYPILKKYNIPATFFIATGYVNKLAIPSPDCGDTVFMDWEELKEVAENNISIGAHTVRHRILSNLSVAELEKEIVDSKNEIEQRIGKKVISFAYPNGKKRDYDLGKCVPILEKNGFKLAVSTIGGFNDIKVTDNCFDLHRMGLSYGDSLNTFRLKVGLGSFWQR